MKTEFYSVLDRNLSIQLPESIDSTLLKQHLPGIKYLHFSPKRVEYQIRFIESELDDINYDSNNLIIYGKWDHKLITDFPHLLYSYLKYVCFQKHVYLLHSVIVEDTLFLGCSGSGKTTLAQQAIEKGFHIGGVDRTAVSFSNGFKVLAATDVLSVRRSQEQPELRLLCESDDRFIYDVSDILDTKLHIKRIAFFKVNHEYNRFSEINGLSKTHQLYPWFLDTIKTDCFIAEGKILFSPFYNDKLKKHLFDKLNNLNTPLYFIENSIDNILDWTVNG